MEYSGVLLGLVLIFLGGLQSWYISMMLLPCIEKTGKTRYEDYARIIYGPFMEKVTAWIIILCALGLVVSYSIFL